MTSDRVGDFIIRLKNAGAVGKKEVRLPYSSHLEAIAKKLRALGYVGVVSTDAKDEKGIKKELIVGLLYDAHGKTKINGVQRISKPGRRLYAHASEAHGIKGGMGTRVFSTPTGIVSDREARKGKVGGESLFDIW
jgi:small subunit ribosomal protein S8